MNNEKSPSGDDLKLLIQERIKNFWGYGNLESRVWFVGMEEGYNEKTESLEARFRSTAGKQVFDVFESLKGDEGHVVWFKKGARTQPTYRPLIFLLLYMRTGKTPSLEDIRQYQIEEFGRASSDMAALELMPLPSKSINERDWIYAPFGIEGLSSRKEYLKTYKPERVRALRELIKQHEPRLVVFYSLTYLNDWKQVVGIPMEEAIPGMLYAASDGRTLYAVVPHSVARGISRNHWKEMAEAIRNRLPARQLSS